MTCWHCVRAELPPKHIYAAGVMRNDQAIAYPLANIERDNNGSDLALASIDLVPKAGFKLSAKAFFPGADVFTYGFPLTEKIRLEGGKTAIKFSPRFTAGYITRTFLYASPGNRPNHTYELSFPALQGLSGAPLLAFGPSIIGVVYGNIDAYTIVEESSQDPKSGEIRPETRRIISFGLAFHTDVTRSVRTSLTAGRQLCDCLETSKP
jgi:hypothetical protein